MTNIEVFRTNGDLARKRWRFSFDDRRLTLFVDAYSEESRQTKRHAFKPDRWYSFHDTRSNSLSVDDVPLPQDVMDEVLGEFRAMIKVGKWSEPKPTRKL